MVSLADPLAWIDALGPAERAALLNECAEQLNREKIADYRPYKKQREFHGLGKTMRERLLVESNQPTVNSDLR